MISNKYLMIICIIVALLVLYYFYDEISNVKKLFLPTYQKTMTLESKTMALEKKINEIIISGKKSNKLDSPPMSITYHSDMVKNGNLSVRYSDLSDSEAQKILQQVNIFRSENNESQQKKNKSLDNNFTKSNDTMQQECFEKILEPLQNDQNTTDTFC